MNKLIQAKHIADERIIAIVERCQRMRPEGEHFRFSTGNFDGHPWALLWDVEAALPMFPSKVVLAKLKTMIHRGRIQGCPCGCRGDFQVIHPSHWKRQG